MLLFVIIFFNYVTHMYFDIFMSFPWSKRKLGQWTYKYDFQQIAWGQHAIQRLAERKGQGPFPFVFGLFW